MPSLVKKRIVGELEGLFEGVSEVLVVRCRGVTGREMADARKEFRRAGVEMEVVKHKLVRLAVKGGGMGRMGSLLDGPSAVVFGGEEGVLGLAKVMAGWKKKVGVVEVLGGVSHGAVLSPGKVERLSKLGSVERIRAELVGSLVGPASCLVGVLQQLLACVVHALEGIKEKQGGSAQAG